MLNQMNKDKNYAGYKIGRYTYGNPRIESWSGCGKLEIGSFCSIARGVTIFLGGDHHTEWVSTSPIGAFLGVGGYPQIRTDGDVIIGNDAWFGIDVLILSGVSIGDGAVIGARTVVAKSIPPYCVAVGNPARVVKKRFSDEIIEKLLKIKWWNWEDALIKERIPILMSGDVQKFVDAFGG